MIARPENASICPLCGADNNCALSSTQSTESPNNQHNSEDACAGCSKNSLDCWCSAIILNQQQKILLKNSTDGTRCLCQSCLMKLAKNGL